MITDPTTTARDNVDQAVRRAIDALANLGDLERLHPVDRIAVGQAAEAFANVVTAATRRRAGTGRGKRGTQRGAGARGDALPGGDAA